MEGCFITILIEGMDNTGKTTLIQKIMEAFPDSLEMVKPPGPFGSKAILLDWLIPSLKSISKATPEDKIVLFDRYPLFSEPIYGTEIRGYSMLTPEEVEEGIKVLRNSPQPVIIILCRPPDSTILNFGEREQMDGVIERSQRLIARYDDLIKGTAPTSGAVSVYLYDWTSGSNLWVYSLIKKHIKAIKGDY